MHESNRLSTNSFAVVVPLVDGDHGRLGLRVAVDVNPERKHERVDVLVLDAEDPVVKPEIALETVRPLPGEVGHAGHNAPKHAAPEAKVELVNATALVA